MEALYLDSSALVKLVVAEAESAALHDFLLSSGGRTASSVVAAVEVPRAARRVGIAAAEARAYEVVRSVVLLQLAPDVLEKAVSVEPSSLSSLDAIHLASALSLGPELGAFVAYDERLSRAAASAGMPVRAPR